MLLYAVKHLQERPCALHPGALHEFNTQQDLKGILVFGVKDDETAAESYSLTVCGQPCGVIDGANKAHYVTPCQNGHESCVLEATAHSAATIAKPLKERTNISAPILVEKIADKSENPRNRNGGAADENNRTGASGPRHQAKRPQQREAGALVKRRSLGAAPKQHHCHQEPAARWGHTMTEVQDHHVLIGGQGDGGKLMLEGVWSYRDGEWAELSVSGDVPKKRMGHTAVYSSTEDALYLFGGSMMKSWFNDIHALDLKTLEWRQEETSGKPPTSAYHSCTLFRNELYVFGGINDSKCTNILRAYNIEHQGWYEAHTMGSKPAPRSGHTATLYDDNILVIVAGWDAPVCYNDVYFLDMGMLDFTKAETTGDAPTPRRYSWHAAVLMDQSTLLIYGGFDGFKSLNDAYALNLETLVWRKVSDALLPEGRAGHSMWIHRESGEDVCHEPPYMANDTCPCKDRTKDLGTISCRG